jgi:hypothetical protein
MGRATQGALRTNQRTAAPTKNSAPMTTLSRTLAVRANNRVMAPGQSQQTAPAAAKMMAKDLINIVTTLFPAIVRRARPNKVQGDVSAHPLRWIKPGMPKPSIMALWPQSFSPVRTLLSKFNTNCRTTRRCLTITSRASTARAARGCIS